MKFELLPIDAKKPSNVDFDWSLHSSTSTRLVVTATFESPKVQVQLYVVFSLLDPHRKIYNAAESESLAVDKQILITGQI